MLVADTFVNESFWETYLLIEHFQNVAAFLTWSSMPPFGAIISTSRREPLEASVRYIPGRRGSFVLEMKRWAPLVGARAPPSRPQRRLAVTAANACVSGHRRHLLAEPDLDADFRSYRCFRASTAAEDGCCSLTAHQHCHVEDQARPARINVRARARARRTRAFSRFQVQSYDDSRGSWRRAPRH